MPQINAGIAAKDFLNDPEVAGCLAELHQLFGDNGERLVVSDVLDTDGHQYVNLVQKGGGVLGVALVGYTYILEQMNIRFIRLAGTSAGAINTALMTVIGGTSAGTSSTNGKAWGDKKMAKSEVILNAICELNFFDLVDGHPAARWLIKRFITNVDFTSRVKKWITWLTGLLLALPVLSFISLGLQHRVEEAAVVTQFLFIITGFYFLMITLIATYFFYLVDRLKVSGFGINPGDFFYDWMKKKFDENGVYKVSDLVSKAATPVQGLHLRVGNKEGINDLDGDVTFITSELVTQNKIEFPKMWYLFRHDMDLLQPAGFVRASMSIPIFFESYFINDIPCASDFIRKGWESFGEKDPPSTARFVDGGILSNFPINLFYNAKVDTPRLPSFGIDLDDSLDANEISAANKPSPPTNGIPLKKENDAGKNPERWSFGGYLGRLFNTVRFYYDKDFLIKNAFFKKGIGVIPLKGFGWLNFFFNE